MSKNVDDIQPILLTTAGGKRMAEYDFFFPIVPSGIELKFGVLERIIDRPTGKSPRHRNNVLLGVTPVYSERVQLHQLTPIVFIETGSPNARWHVQIITKDLRLPVVEIVEHCRMPRRCQKQVFEVS